MKQFSKYLALVLMSMVLFSSCGKKDEPRKPKPTPEKPDEPQDLSKLNVLAFVAEYDVNKAGTGFTTNHYVPTSKEYAKWEDSDAGLFTWDEAKALFKKDFLKDYVLPSKEQWLSIIKKGNIFFNKEQSKVSVEEKYVVIGNEPKQTYQSEFITKDTPAGYLTFALRFKGTKWESAWAYYPGGRSVTIRCLGGLKDSGKTLEEIVTPAFFQDKSKKLVTRVFPACGFRKFDSPTVSYMGEGYYWSSTPNGYVLFGREAGVYSSGGREHGLAVRPFHKELPQK